MLLWQHPLPLQTWDEIIMSFRKMWSASYM